MVIFMEEKRRAKRVKVKLNLEISSLFKQDNVKVKDIEAPITVVDISRGGIGFHSVSRLPIGYYFNACLKINEDNNARLYCVVKIIRAAELEHNMISYGCEFIGLAPVFSYIFDELEQDG